LETHKPSYVSRAAKPFFIPVVHDLSSVVGHVVAPEPSLAGRQGPEPWNTWRHQSPP
jgi:hypothetical protein